MEDLEVIVIGAGMAGLTSAIALQQAGYRVSVFEKVQELRPAGAAISLWSNGVKILNRLGLAKPLAEIGGEMRTMGYRDGFSGKSLTHFSLEPLIAAVGQPPLPVSRTDLQNLLLAQVENVSFGKKLIEIQETPDRVIAIFEDGSRAEGDVLVAADGTHSSLRNYVLGKKIERHYAGYVNWNGLVTAAEDLAPEGAWVTYVGDGKRVSLMPVAGGRLYYFFDVPLEFPGECDRGAIREELCGHFHGWAEPVRTLIGRIDPFTTARIPIHDVPPLENLVRGRVALVGDSGHSMVPDLGQGGCQAMESAWVLASCLKSHSLGVEDSLKRYEKRRLERVAAIIQAARKRSDVTHGIDELETRAWYEELKNEDGVTIRAAIERTIAGGPLA
ncbi:MAG: FAD-dependent urate hydroxylase HpxO [Luteolibacter sp.]